YVKDKAVAMTLGCEISPIAFDICFEKALREYDGIYAVINNEFAKTLSSYKYINREEDMGIEGLKKSKLSYNPIILIARYNATLKNDGN
ncbi:phosphatidylglycerol lysyltransferase domain-containing protein, partial [Ruminococcus sp.]